MTHSVACIPDMPWSIEMLYDFSCKLKAVFSEQRSLKHATQSFHDELTFRIVFVLEIYNIDALRGYF